MVLTLQANRHRRRLGDLSSTRTRTSTNKMDSGFQSTSFSRLAWSVEQNLAKPNNDFVNTILADPGVGSGPPYPDPGSATDDPTRDRGLRRRSRPHTMRKHVLRASLGKQIDHTTLGTCPSQVMKLFHVSGFLATCLFRRM